MKTHVVYAGRHYWWTHENRLRSLILDGMRKYRIETVMMTMFNLRRKELITKEKMENYCNGKENDKDSVNDDLERFFGNLRLEKPSEEYVRTYFLPKLTEAEMDLVDNKDTDYFDTLTGGLLFSNVRENQMKQSGSDSKFVHGQCYRKTFTIKNSSQNIFNSCLFQ